MAKKPDFYQIQEAKAAVWAEITSVEEFSAYKDEFISDHDRILSEMSDDLDYIFNGIGWRSWYSSSPFRETDLENYKFEYGSMGLGNIWNVAFTVFLSRKGFVRNDETEHNYVPFARPSSPDDKMFSENRIEITMRTLRVVEKHIQQHHPDLNIRYIAFNPESDDPKCRSRLMTWNFSVYGSSGIKYSPWNIDWMAMLQ